MNIYDQIRSFAMRHQLLNASIVDVEQQHRVSIVERPTPSGEGESEYYLQFDQLIRDEAAAMSLHYEVFYCLEKSIRKLVEDKMSAEIGVGWWDSNVPQTVREAVEKNKQRELDSAMTPRSSANIDYTTFGELGEIVRNNWNVFADTFNSRRGFDRVMASLNMLRGPIAHCSPLADDEVDRLKLTLRDWFRLME